MKKFAIILASAAALAAPAFAASNDEKLDIIVQSFLDSGCEAAGPEELEAMQKASGLSQEDFGAGFVLLMVREQIVEGASGGPRLVHPDCK
jgi:opacity protein-like surface antigen